MAKPFKPSDPQPFDIAKGDYVQMTCRGYGDVDLTSDGPGGGMIEVHYEPGEVGFVENIQHYGPHQGWAVTISMACGVVNVFDQADTTDVFAFTKIKRGEAMRALFHEVWRARVSNVIETYCQSLDKLQLPPNGDDFNRLVSFIETALTRQEIPEIKLTKEGR